MRVLNTVNFLALFLVYIPGIFSQTFNNTIKDSHSEKESEFRLSLRYTSDYLFMGRSDSLASPYLSAGFTYLNATGFFIHTSLSYLTLKEQARVDMIKLSGGYDYYKKKFEAGVMLTEYFFSDQSFVVQAEMSTYLHAYAGYDFGVLMGYVNGSLGFSEQVDGFVGLELNRSWHAFKNKLRITPAFYVNAGTQNYYNEYIQNRSSQGKALKGKGKWPAQSANTISEQVQEFKILDYEAEVQLMYTLGPIKFYASATWAFPVNPYTATTTTGTYTEELNTGFYWSGGLRYTF